MANVRHQKPKLKADIPTLFRLYTENAVIDAKNLREAFGISPNTALRAIRLCDDAAKEQGVVFYTNHNEIPTDFFFKFYGWDISQINYAFKIASDRMDSCC